MPTHLTDRFHALPGPTLADQVQLRTGTLRDYAALASHHYRANRPATAKRVLVFEQTRPSAAARFVHGSREDRPKRIAAVLVESLPALACTMRDQAFDHRYGSWLGARQRAALVNDELRCISRVVVSPPWRGLGLAVRIVAHALATAQTPFTEALAVMGKVHPFFERAGMRAYHRPPHWADARLASALSWLGLAPDDLAMPERMVAHMERSPPAQRALLQREVKRWFNQRGQSRSPNAGKTRSSNNDLHTQLKAAQRGLLFQPVYYLHDNRSDRELASR